MNGFQTTSKQYVKQPGTYTATFEGGQLKDKKPNPKYPNARPSQYLMLEFKTTQGEWIAQNFPIDMTHPKITLDTKARHEKTKLALGLGANDKFNQARGKVVSLIVVPNEYNGKTYMNISEVLPAGSVQASVVSAAQDVFDV
jgi:hypothetical protein